MTTTSPRQSPFLTTAEVAERLRCSVRSIHERTRMRQIPFRRFSGSRRCLFLVEELEAWERGDDLEVNELPGGGCVVRPVESYSTRSRAERTAANGSLETAEGD
jgi:excisionase family DNA binding protein